MRRALVLIGSGAFTFAVVYFAAHFHGHAIAWTLLGFGFFMFLSATSGGRRVLARLGVHTTEQRANDLVRLGAGPLVLGLAIFTAIYLLPRVDGTLVRYGFGKGRSYFLVVADDNGTHEVIGNGDLPRCPLGDRVQKDAWSLAYTCAGVPVANSSVGISIVLAIEFAFSWIWTAALLAKAAK